MSLESNIKDCIQKELEKGVIEKVIAQKLEESVSKAVEDMFGWNGCVKNAIKEQLESTMIPYIENYNYSEFIPKLDVVMVEVLKTVGGDSKKILENFSHLMTTEKLGEKIKLSEIYEKWCNHVKENIDKTEIDYDSYEGGCIDVSSEIEDIEYKWSDRDEKIIRFECDADDSFNVEFKIKPWYSNKDVYSIEMDVNLKDIRSLRHMSEFDMYLLRIKQGYHDIIDDLREGSEELYLEGEY